MYSTPDVCLYLYVYSDVSMVNEYFTHRYAPLFLFTQQEKTYAQKFTILLNIFNQNRPIRLKKTKISYFYNFIVIEIYYTYKSWIVCWKFWGSHSKCLFKWFQVLIFYTWNSNLQFLPELDWIFAHFFSHIDFCEDFWIWCKYLQLVEMKICVKMLLKKIHIDCILKFRAPSETARTNRIEGRKHLICSSKENHPVMNKIGN